MALPYSRNQTYVAGTTPIAAADMNALQDYAVRAQKAHAGSDFLFYDDFVGGTTFDLSKWTVSAGGILTQVTAADACGVADFSTAGNNDENLSTFGIAIGAADFELCARVKLASIGGGTSFVSIGFLSNRADWRADAGGTNWFYNKSGTSTNSGVAFSTTTFDVLEIIRASGTQRYLINGVEIDSFADAHSYTTEALQFRAKRDTSGTTDIQLDMIKLRADR